MKISKIKTKLDKILGLSSKENEMEKTLAVISTLLDKLNQKEAKLKKKLSVETEASSIKQLEQKLKLIKRQKEKAQAYKNEISA